MQYYLNQPFPVALSTHSSVQSSFRTDWKEPPSQWAHLFLHFNPSQHLNIPYTSLTNGKAIQSIDRHRNAKIPERSISLLIAFCGKFIRFMFLLIGNLREIAYFLGSLERGKTCTIHEKVYQLWFGNYVKRKRLPTHNQRTFFCS